MDIHLFFAYTVSMFDPNASKINIAWFVNYVYYSFHEVERNLGTAIYSRSSLLARSWAQERTDGWRQTKDSQTM
jgi:hypothetical protein